MDANNVKKTKAESKAKEKKPTTGSRGGIVLP